MSQYVELGNRILDKGKWVENERTGERCLTVINADMTYDVGAGEFPIDTTRKSFWKAAVAELLGYIRGYSSAEDFRKLGTKTWDANANLNEAWLANERRIGEDDMGVVYGAIGNEWPVLEHDPNGRGEFLELQHVDSLDQLKKIYEDLKAGKDDRGEIWNFWNPGVFQLGCLRPCMYSHHFSLLDGELFLNSTQRSVDTALGLSFNMVQVYALLAVMAQITANEAGEAYHKLINVHIYEKHHENFKEQMKRKPFNPPKFVINPNIKTLEDLRTWVTIDDFDVIGYEHHEAIKYEMAV